MDTKPTPAPEGDLLPTWSGATVPRDLVEAFEHALAGVFAGDPRPIHNAVVRESLDLAIVRLVGRGLVVEDGRTIAGVGGRPGWVPSPGMVAQLLLGGGR